MRGAAACDGTVGRGGLSVAACSLVAVLRPEARGAASTCSKLPPHSSICAADLRHGAGASERPESTVAGAAGAAGREDDSTSSRPAPCHASSGGRARSRIHGATSSSGCGADGPAGCGRVLCCSVLRLMISESEPPKASALTCGCALQGTGGGAARMASTSNGSGRVSTPNEKTPGRRCTGRRITSSLDIAKIGALARRRGRMRELLDEKSARLSCVVKEDLSVVRAGFTFFSTTKPSTPWLLKTSQPLASIGRALRLRDLTDRNHAACAPLLDHYTHGPRREPSCARRDENADRTDACALSTRSLVSAAGESRLHHTVHHSFTPHKPARTLCTANATNANDGHTHTRHNHKALAVEPQLFHPVRAP